MTDLLSYILSLETIDVNYCMCLASVRSRSHRSCHPERAARNTRSCMLDPRGALIVIDFNVLSDVTSIVTAPIIFRVMLSGAGLIWPGRRGTENSDQSKESLIVIGLRLHSRIINSPFNPQPQQRQSITRPPFATNPTMTNLNMRTATRADVASICGASAADVAERLAAMRLHEASSHYRPVDYLRSLGCPPSLASEHRRSRSVMCRWCYRLADACDLSRHAAVRASGYLDRYLASGRAPPDLPGDPRGYQLAAMTALYISVKLHEPMRMDAALLADVSRGCYGVPEILDTERKIIEALGWRMCGPTPQEFLCLYLALLDPREYGHDLDVLGGLLDLSTFQCELAVSDYDLSVNCRPSVVALASVLNGLDGIDEDSIPAEARYEIKRRLCSLVLSNNIANFAQVGCVQFVLRQLLVQNSGNELLMAMRNSENIPRSSCDECTAMKIICDDTECPSPVSIAPRRYSQFDHDENQFAKCA